MELSTISTLMTGTLSNFGDEVLVVLTATIGIAIAYYLFCWFWRVIPLAIEGKTWTRWSWLDRHTYKPYKGYNRLRSRKWNMEHTMG